MTDDVTRLRTITADGEALRGVRRRGEVVLFESNDAKRFMWLPPNSRLVWTASVCTTCDGERLFTDDDRDFGSKWPCPNPDCVDGVVERIPDRLIGPGSEWADGSDTTFQGRMRFHTPAAMRARGWTLVRPVPPARKEQQ